MNLILWRHAQAAEGLPDLERSLTPKGREQAETMATWLRQRLPERYAMLASPAQRTRQTAAAMGVEYRTSELLLPGADVADYLAAIDWPEGPAESRGTVIVVGHQPVLGRLASLLISGVEADWNVRKGAVWWLSSRDKENGRQMTIRSAISPDLA